MSSPASGSAQPADVAQPLLGQVALITGAARRVGRAIALHLAEQGMDIAFTYNRSKEAAAQTAQEIRDLGRQAECVWVEMSEAGAAEHIHRWFCDRFHRLDALVNNASCFSPSPLDEVTPESFDYNMAVNARTPLMLIQAFAEALGARYDPADPTSPGRIVNFIDIHVMGQPLKRYVVYNASKAALMEITMTAAMELAPRVTVNALAPGVVAWAESYSDEMRQQYMKRVPLDRPGSPEDAAKAAGFLIHDAGYCTGQIIKLDGGRLLT